MRRLLAWGADSAALTPELQLIFGSTVESQQKDLRNVRKAVDRNLPSGDDATSLQSFWTAQSTTIEEREFWRNVWGDLETKCGFTPEFFEENRERIFLLLRGYALENGLSEEHILPQSGPACSTEQAGSVLRQEVASCSITTPSDLSTRSEELHHFDFGFNTQRENLTYEPGPPNLSSQSVSNVGPHSVPEVADDEVTPSSRQPAEGPGEATVRQRPDGATAWTLFPRNLNDGDSYAERTANHNGETSTRPRSTSRPYTELWKDTNAPSPQYSPFPTGKDLTLADALSLIPVPTADSIRPAVETTLASRPIPGISASKKRQITLLQVLNRRTQRPYDLFSFYDFVKDNDKAVDLLDFW